MKTRCPPASLERKGIATEVNSKNESVVRSENTASTVVLLLFHRLYILLDGCRPHRV
jgi:hypothetical protein